MECEDRSPEAILASIEEAIKTLPYPFCVFDNSERALVASNGFMAEFSGLELDPGKPLYEMGVTLEDVTRARVESGTPPGQLDAKLELEMRRLRSSGMLTKDLMLNGKWVRRIKSESASGHMAVLAVPIEEFVQRARDLAKAKREMEHQAFHDPLTDLPNRRALNAYLKQLLQRDMVAEDVVVFHVDLDKFKLINDTLGHDAGDCVLLQASKILRAEVRANDFVARVGGDEFIMVFADPLDQEDIERVAKRIIERMKEPIYYEDQACQIGASIGIAIREEVTSPERMIMDADIALYEAKIAGRGRYSFFSANQRARHTALKKRVIEVREAIIMNAFEPFFQPQINAKTGEVTGFEALARWRDREAGIRPPSEFISALDEANLRAELDEMVIRKTLRRMEDWDSEEIKVPSVSVNVSSSLLSNPEAADKLKWLCDDANVNPDRIQFEMLESVVFQDHQGAQVANIARMKEAGFTIALDNFGTGSASISSLRRLSPDRIKISRELVLDINKDPEARTIVSAMISLAKELGIETLCEGVEKPEERDLLQDIGCDYVQGFLYSKPLDPDSVPIWLDEYYEDLRPAKLRA